MSLHTVLNDSQLQVEFFFEDDATVTMESIQKQGVIATTLTEICPNFNRGSVSMEIPLRIDIYQQEEEIINGVPVCVELYPSSNAFCLMAYGDTAYKVNITDAILSVLSGGYGSTY